MKTFEQFIIETDNWTRPNDMSSFGGGTDVSQLDPRQPLTPEQRRKLQNRQAARGAAQQRSGYHSTPTSTSSPASTSGSSSAPPPGTRPTGSSTSSPSGASYSRTNQPRPYPSSSSSRFQTGQPQPRTTPSTWMRNIRTAGSNLGRVASPIATTAGSGFAAYDEYLNQKARGRSTAAALAISGIKAAGGAIGGSIGAKLGGLVKAGLGTLGAGPIGTAVGGAAGAIVGGSLGYGAGSGLAGGAAETIAGATRKEKIAAAIANRRRQSGGGLSGIGGQTTFSQTRPGGPSFMSTGVGRQRRTAQLASTSLVRDPRTNKLETGNLAFRTDPTGRRQAVYKRAADPSTLARTSSNWLERVGRTISPGSYAAQDERVRRARLMQAARSDIQRQQTLGVAGSRNLVGPRIVGPKIVGPRKATPTQTQGPIVRPPQSGVRK